MWQLPVTDHVEGRTLAELVTPEDPHALARAMRRLIVEPSGSSVPPEVLRDAAKRRSWTELMTRYVEVYSGVTEGRVRGEIHGDGE